jgi:nicotinamide riboside kinase
MQKKIALDGSVSVAKTTTVDCLRPALALLNGLDRKNGDPGPIVEIVTEAAREVFEKYPKLDRSGREADFRIVNKIISNECRVFAETDAQILICDRSLLSPLAFAACNDAPHLDDLKNNAQIRAHLKTYDHFLLLSPKNVPFIQDDVRIEDESFRTRLHETFLDLLREMEVPYTLLEGPTMQRVSQVLAVLTETYWGR